MSRRSRAQLRSSTSTPFQAVLVLTALIVFTTGWAVWTLLSPVPAGTLAALTGQFQRTVSGWMLWSLLITVPGIVVAWRFALRDRDRVLHARASRAELAALTPEQFERWCAVRLEALGYRVRRVAGVGDHGVDLVAERDGKVTVVQCKRNTSSRNVGEPQVRDLFGAMHDQQANAALLMSAGSISASAKQWARGKPIELWDLDALAALPNAVPATNLEVTVPVDRPALENCPRCDSPLIARTARSSGAAFIGCSSFPKCRYTRPA